MIEITDLRKEYKTNSGTVTALNGLTMKVNPGQRIGLLGNNGSGKSTLIRLIGGIEVPTSGKITRRMSVSWPLAFRGGFQNELSAYGNLRFLARVYDRPYEEIADFVEDFTELRLRLKDPVYTYSSGMRAKLSFGVSLAFEFDCYLIDEVLAVGDAQFRRKCRIELFEKRQDRSILMVSHQARSIQEACTLGLLLQNGNCVETFDIKSDKSWRRYTKSD